MLMIIAWNKKLVKLKFLKKFTDILFITTVYCVCTNSSLPVYHENVRFFIQKILIKFDILNKIYQNIT